MSAGSEAEIDSASSTSPVAAIESEAEPPSSQVDASTGKVRTNIILFVVTVFSMFLTGAGYATPNLDYGDPTSVLLALPSGWRFAVPLLAILLTHEFGHYFAARYHRVPASLPYFIPLPILSPFGTMGAVISMKGAIRSKNALLDIGASGPLAGLVVAIPVVLIGLAESQVHPLSGAGVMEGQSLLYLFLKWLMLGTIPPGHDVYLSPVAFAGWAGLFVTAINLLPVGQLDGGHVAYALFGPRQNKYGLWIHRALLLVFAYNIIRFAGPSVVQGNFDNIGQAIGNSMFWLVWFALLGWIRKAGGEHPPTDDHTPLSPARTAGGILCLILFVLLFMPTPLSTYGDV